jgi:hypothetical protein
MPEYEQYSTSASQSKNYNNSTYHNFSINTPINLGSSLNANVNYNYIDSQSYSQSNAATYNGNPFVGENNELMEEEQLAAITLNRRSSESSNRSHQQSLGLQSNYYTYFDGEADAHIEVRMNLNTNSGFQSSTEHQQTDYLQYGDSVWHYLRESIAPDHSESIGLSASGGFSFGPKKFRQNLNFNYEFTKERVGYFETETLKEFFRAVADQAGMNIHIKVLDGENTHHIIEATFKGFANALNIATSKDGRKGVLSTKGTL